GGIVMGRIAERVGVRWTVMFGAAMVCVGLAISSLGRPWHLFAGHGLFIGLIGNGGINAPLYVYVTKWFDRHRGSALALISSGVYIAGAIWPPIFERIVAAVGVATNHVDLRALRDGRDRPACRHLPPRAARNCAPARRQIRRP